MNSAESWGEPCSGLKWSPYIPALRGIALSSLIAAALVMIPEIVWAQATPIGTPGAYTPSAGSNSFGDFMCRVKSQTSSIPNVFAWFAYVTGVFFVARCLMLLKDHTENPQQVRLSKPLLFGLAGSMALALPGVTSAIITSIYGVGVGGATACVAQTGLVAGPGLDVLARNFVANIHRPVMTMGAWICYFMGVFFLYRGIDKMARYGTDPRAYSLTAIVSNLFFGAVIMMIGRSKDVIMQSIFDPAIVGVSNPLVYATLGGVGLINWAALGVVGPTLAFDQTYIAATTFMQIVGFIGFLRGWFLCKRAVEGVGNATIGQGLTHIIGGALCMNLILFLKAAQATFNIPNFLT